MKKNHFLRQKQESYFLLFTYFGLLPISMDDWIEGIVLYSECFLEYL